MSDNILMFVVAQVATAAGVYAAIRADMREYQVRIAMLEKHNEKQLIHVCKS